MDDLFFKFKEWLRENKTTMKFISSEINVAQSNLSMSLKNGNPSKKLVEKLILAGVPLRILFSEEILKAIKKNDEIVFKNDEEFKNLVAEISGKVAEEKIKEFLYK